MEVVTPMVEICPRKGYVYYKMLFFQYILFHPFKSMSNYGNTLWMQMSSQISTPPLWFESPRSPNIDKGVVYTIRGPSSLNRVSVHEDQPTHNVHTSNGSCWLAMYSLHKWFFLMLFSHVYNISM